jgi:hypothetical protein
MGMFGCMSNSSHSIKILLSQLSKISHLNPALYFSMAKGILPYFYKSLIGGIKIIS